MDVTIIFSQRNETRQFFKFEAKERIRDLTEVIPSIGKYHLKTRNCDCCFPFGIPFLIKG